MPSFRSLIALLLFCLVAAMPAPPRQVATTVDDQGWCDDIEDWNSGEHHCEVREMALPDGSLTVSSGNGGIHVQAWDGDGIRVRVRVASAARTEERARELAASVRVSATGNEVSADGPDGGSREWWSASYRIDVPRVTDLDLSASNGGIDIEGVRGRLRFKTSNGGVELDGVAGDVQGRTTNGGVRVRLSGTTWDGDGLDVSTTNGGVRVIVPEPYDAVLELGTRNGGFDVDFPVTLNRSRDKSLTLDLGAGGPLLRITTTNGGVKLQRS